jgi:serine/threonine protein kinase
MKAFESDQSKTTSDDMQTEYSPPRTNFANGTSEDTQTAEETKGREIPADLDYLLLGKYRLIKLLGKGGMGSVYLAEHTELRKLVAIKIISDELCLRPQFVNLFKREARSSAKLQHPNIARVFDYGQEKGKCLYVMDYVQGNSLAEIIRTSAPMGLRKSLSIFRQILEALSHAHTSGILHRDIKPSNILVDDAGTVKLLDFGLARSVYGDDSLTAAGQSPGGTPNYMSPEQRKGEATDARTDIYSAGVTLFELLTGTLPRDVSAPREQLVGHLRKGLGPLQKGRATQVANIVMKCLDDVGTRYRTADEVLAEVQRIERKEQQQRWVLRSAAGAIIVAGAAVGAFMLFSPPRSLANTAVRHLEASDFSEAAKLFADLSRKDPSDVKSRYGLGLSYLGLGKLDRAEAEFNEIAASFGRETTADEEGLARIALTRRDEDKAHELYEKAVGTGKDRTLIHVTMGDVYFLRNQLDEAIEEYEKALDRKPMFRFQLADAYSGLGKAYARKGEVDQGVSLLRRAQDSRPSNLEISSALGYLLMKKGDYKEALAAIERAQEKHPNDSLALFLKSQISQKNDADQQKRISALVDDLIQKAGQASPTAADEERWESRPMALGILDLKKAGFAFSREGEYEMLMFNLSRAMQETGRVSMVEREVLEELLKELKLGASELASPEAALRLGKIFPAGLIATGSLRGEKGLFGIDLRIAETETTKLRIWLSQTQEEGESMAEFAERLAQQLTEKLRAIYPLKAKVVKLSDEQVTLNIGSKQGLAAGAEMRIVGSPGDSDLGRLVVKETGTDSAVAQVVEAKGDIVAGTRTIEIVKGDAR